MAKTDKLTKEQIDNYMQRLDKMSIEIEQSLAEAYNLDFAGKSDKEKSDMIKAALKAHEKKINRK
jgi:type II secretory pathway component PulM